MNKQERREILQELAEKDLVKGADIYDHPCSVALRDIVNREAMLLRAAKELKGGNSERMIATYEDINIYLDNS